VGGKTQLKAYRAVAGDLRLSYAQFEELEAFARFGTQLDEETRKTLKRGRRVREILKQPQYRPMRVAEQISSLVAVNEGVYDAVEREKIKETELKISAAVLENLPDLCERIEGGEQMTEKDIQEIVTTANRVLV
jgi:F-type H+/Na+-transporting ATPase subunit alpha